MSAPLSAWPPAEETHRLLRDAHRDRLAALPLHNLSFAAFSAYFPQKDQRRLRVDYNGIHDASKDAVEVDYIVHLAAPPLAFAGVVHILGWRPRSRVLSYDYVFGGDSVAAREARVYAERTWPTVLCEADTGDEVIIFCDTRGAAEARPLVAGRAARPWASFVADAMQHRGMPTLDDLVSRAFRLDDLTTRELYRVRATLGRHYVLYCGGCGACATAAASSCVICGAAFTFCDPDSAPQVLPPGLSLPRAVRALLEDTGPCFTHTVEALRAVQRRDAARRVADAVVAAMNDEAERYIALLGDDALASMVRAQLVPARRHGMTPAPCATVPLRRALSFSDVVVDG